MDQNLLVTSWENIRKRECLKKNMQYFTEHFTGDLYKKDENSLENTRKQEYLSKNSQYFTAYFIEDFYNKDEQTAFLQPDNILNMFSHILPIHYNEENVIEDLPLLFLLEDYIIKKSMYFSYQSSSTRSCLFRLCKAISGQETMEVFYKFCNYNTFSIIQTK